MQLIKNTQSKQQVPLQANQYSYTPIRSKIILYNTLVLLYEANQNINVKVKTAYGLSVENCLEQIGLQGDTWAPLMASNQVDKFGKHC